MLTLAVALAAGVGAVARYVVDAVVRGRTRAPFPYGTFVVNISGSLLLGLLTGLSLHSGLSSTAVVVGGAGFAGGFTTLSTWTWETVALTEAGEVVAAGINVVASLAVGLAAAAAGLGLALL
jgi:CrcB protein